MWLVESSALETYNKFFWPKYFHGNFHGNLQRFPKLLYISVSVDVVGMVVPSGFVKSSVGSLLYVPAKPVTRFIADSGAA